MVAVLALTLLGLGAGGPSAGGTPAGSSATSLNGVTVEGQDSQPGYESAIQAAQHAVQQASGDANSAASANP
jgi:hypothetical protein